MDELSSVYKANDRLFPKTGSLAPSLRRAGLYHSQPGKREVLIMREGIHPKYQECKVTCGCGNTFMTGSTATELRVDVCSKCHPFFTGRQRDVAAGGRIEKFNRRYGRK